ncbi:MAG: thioredoxin fold domain-containing protein [Bacteroidota bacterium]
MIRSLLFAVALLLPLGAQAQVDASIIPDDAPAWVSMEEAIAGAEADGKTIIVHGYAVWCGWCAKFDEDVYTDDDVQAYLAENFRVTRLDLEDTTAVRFFDAEVTYQQLGQAMGITGTPTTVFVASDGSLITKLPGYTDAETFYFALQYVNEAAYETTPFGQFMEARRAGLSVEQATDDLRPPPRGEGE